MARGSTGHREGTALQLHPINRPAPRRATARRPPRAALATQQTANYSGVMTYCTSPDHDSLVDSHTLNRNPRDSDRPPRTIQDPPPTPRWTLIWSASLPASVAVEEVFRVRCRRPVRADACVRGTLALMWGWGREGRLRGRLVGQTARPHTRSTVSRTTIVHLLRNQLRPPRVDAQQPCPPAALLMPATPAADPLGTGQATRNAPWRHDG